MMRPLASGYPANGCYNKSNEHSNTDATITQRCWINPAWLQTAVPRPLPLLVFNSLRFLNLFTRAIIRLRRRYNQCIHRS